jgi:hypothetical protein
MRQAPGDVVYWRLLALALDPGRETPELYGLLREGQFDVPLMVDGRIVLFTDRGRAGELLREHGRLIGDEVVDVESPFVVCDVAQALHLLSVGGLDSGSAVLNAVNILLDLVVATGVPFDERRRTALGSIADYCTTKYDLTRYLEEDGDYARQELLDAVLWCVGVVTVMARIA